MGWLRRFFAERRRRRAERVQAFTDANYCSDEQFLKDMGYLPGTLEARVALAIRAAIADEGGELPPEAVRASHSFINDLSAFGSWGSLDTIGLLVCLERRLDTNIPDEILFGMPKVVDLDDPRSTVYDWVRVVTPYFIDNLPLEKLRATTP